MNREEINKLISDYESKWGKLGAGNSILNPEKTAISHSGLNNSNDFYGGKRKMLNMTNDYYEFRRKVAEGKNKNKLAHAATVNIDEINRQYWEKINTDGTLIHTSGRYVPDYEEDDDYLEHAGGYGPASGTNKYYAKIDKFYPDGRTRYFYSKEEWDAYSKNKGYSQNADKNKANKNNPAIGEKEAKIKEENIRKNAEADKQSKYSKIISESTPEAAAKEYIKSADYTNFMDKLEKNFKTGKITSYDPIGHNEPRISGNNGYYDLGNELDDIKDEIDKFIDSIGNEKFKNVVRKDLYSKIRELGRQYKKEYEKLLESSQSQFHERDRWDKQRLNNITDPDDPWLVKQVNNMNYDAIQKQMDLRIDRQNKNGVKMEVMTHSFEDDDDYLEHADRNVKYYQKIKLPNGKIRYFYTREEWDAYQNAEKSNEMEEKRNSETPEGRMRNIAKNAISNPLRTTKDILAANQQRAKEEKWAKRRKIIMDAANNKMSHSYEDDDIDTGVMSEYRAFKARADRGAEMNRLSHSSFISPNELNERYEEEIASHCFLAHAGGYGPASGTNAYVAKIDNFYGQGKPRYFYTQEEWNAYQRNAKGASQAGADRASKETATGVRQNQINNAQKRTAENQRLESQRKNAEAAQNAGADRSEKETGMDVTRQKQVADAKKAIAKREAEAKAKEQSANQAGSAKQGEAEGKGYEEYQKQQAEKKKQEMHEAAKKTITDRDAAIKAGQKSEQDRQKFEETKKTQKEAEASGNNRTQSDTSYSGKDIANALKRNTSKDKIDNLGTELGSILTEYYKVIDNNDDSDAGYKAKRKAWDEYFEKRDEIFNKYGIKFNSPEYSEAQKMVKEIEAEYEKSRKLEGKNLHFKHSALDELNDFKARVALGKEKNRLAHSRMISLTELQHAASNRYGAASGTNKYYAKLDDFYGKGKPRYFYSKAEWDAYQNNMKGAQNADRQKNDQSYRDQNKSFEENRRKNEEAAIGREKEQQAQSYTVKKALEENRRKNEGYAQNAEKDRWANANSDTSTKPSEAVKDNKVENDTKKDDFFKKEHTDYVQKNGDRIVNEYNKATEDEHNVSLQIDEKYGFNKAKTDEELNKCWDNLVQDMYQTALTIDNPDHCYMNFFWHDENGNGSAGWDISIPEFEQWAQEYQKEIDKVFEQGMNANGFDEKKAYGDQWEAMNEELRARSMEAKTKTLQMVTKLKKECLKK